MSTDKVRGSAHFSNKSAPADFPAGSNAWKVLLRYQGRQMTVDYFTGPAITDFSAAEVLESLICDVTLGEQSFEDFCADLGYDQDSRKAERIWKACRAMAPRLRKLLGNDFELFAYSWDLDKGEHASKDRIN